MREALLARCRSEHIEPPGRIERIIGAARSADSDRFCATTAARLGPAAAGRLEQLVADRGEEDDEGGGGRGVLGELKADPGQVSLDSLLAEVDKLERIPSSACPLACSPAHPIPWSAPGGPGPPWSTPPTCASGPGRCASPCWPPCAGLAPVRSPTAWWNCSSASCTRSAPGPRTGSRASCWPTCAGCGARRASCSTSPRPPSSTPTTRSARRCTRWSARPPCATWSKRPRLPRQSSRPGSARRCDRPTPATTAGCCPGCSASSSSGPTTAPTGP